MLNCDTVLRLCLRVKMCNQEKGASTPKQIRSRNKVHWGNLQYALERCAHSASLRGSERIPNKKKTSEEEGNQKINYDFG